MSKQKTKQQTKEVVMSRSKKGSTMLSKIGFVTVAVALGLAFGVIGGYVKLNGDVQVNHAKLNSDAKAAYHKTSSVVHNLAK